MDPTVSTLLAGALGAVIGALGAVGAVWIQERSARRREMFRIVAEIARADRAERIALASKHAGSFELLPFVVELFYFRKVVQLADENRLNATTLTELDAAVQALSDDIRKRHPETENKTIRPRS